MKQSFFIFRILYLLVYLYMLESLIHKLGTRVTSINESNFMSSSSRQNFLFLWLKCFSYSYSRGSQFLSRRISVFLSIKISVNDSSAVFRGKANSKLYDNAQWINNFHLIWAEKFNKFSTLNKLSPRGYAKNSREKVQRERFCVNCEKFKYRFNSGKRMPRLNQSTKTISYAEQFIFY